MIQSRLGKVLVGVLTLLPIGHLIFFIWFVFSSVGAQPQSLGEQQFHLLLKLQLGVMLLMLGLLAFYVTHLFRTNAVANDKKALWCVVLFFGNMFAMIVYWFLYIWPDKPRPNTA